MKSGLMREFSSIQGHSSAWFHEKVLPRFPTKVQTLVRNFEAAITYFYVNYWRFMTMAITKRLLVVGIFFNIGFAGFCVSIQAVFQNYPANSHIQFYTNNCVFVLDFDIWPVTVVLHTCHGAINPRFLVRCLYLHPAERPPGLHVTRHAKSHA